MVFIELIETPLKTKIKAPMGLKGQKDAPLIHQARLHWIAAYSV